MALLQNCVVRFDKIKYKTPYSSIITGTSFQHGSSSDFELEYSGADLIQKIGYIPAIIIPLLKEDLNGILRYGPVNEKELKKRFKNLDDLSYTMDFEKDKAYRNVD